MFYDAFFIITCILAVCMALLALKLVIRSGWLMGWLRGMSGVMLIVMATFFLLVAFDVKNYQSYGDDEPIATISFKQTAPQQFLAVMLIGEDQTPQQFRLEGDQWQLDARVLRWSGLMRTIGGKPGYQLDRISGRYLDMRDEMEKPRSVYSLAQSTRYFDLWRWLYSSRGLVPGVDALYGSATYVPMADDAKYQVGLSNSGLVAKPINESAANAVNAW